MSNESTWPGSKPEPEPKVNILEIVPGFLVANMLTAIRRGDTPDGVEVPPDAEPELTKTLTERIKTAKPFPFADFGRSVYHEN